MDTRQVTLESLFQLTTDLRSEMNQRLEHVDQRLDYIQQKLDYIDKRLEKLENRVDFVENQQMEDRKMLLDIWRNREKVTLTFSKTFAFFNIFIAGVVSSVVAAFVKQN